MGIILAKHSHGDWEVFWFSDNRLDIEHSLDIMPVTLLDEDK